VVLDLHLTELCVYEETVESIEKENAIAMVVAIRNDNIW
jgi:hypothetical protein